MKFLAIILMEILAGAELDLFTPSFAELIKIFHLTPFQVELLLLGNFLTYSLSSLIAGNLGDKYGRKKIILSGLIVFILGSIICVGSTQFWHLILGRIIQGAGISAPAVLSFTIIFDLYSKDKIPKVLGIAQGTITLAMAGAPIVGSYTNLFFNWRGNFALLLILSLVSLVISIMFLPRTPGNRQASLNLAKEYFVVLKSKLVMSYIFSLNFLVIIYWLFVAISPILYVKDLGVNLKQFGFYQGTLCLTFAVTSFFSPYLLDKFGKRKCLISSFWVLGWFFLGVIGILLFKVRNPLLITVVMVLSSLGSILPINILIPHMYGIIENSKGKVSGLFTVFKFGLTGIVIQTVSYFYQGSFLPLGIAMILLLLGSFILLCYLFKADKKLNIAI